MHAWYSPQQEQPKGTCRFESCSPHSYGEMAKWKTQSQAKRSKRLSGCFLGRDKPFPVPLCTGRAVTGAVKATVRLRHTVHGSIPWGGTGTIKQTR